MRHTRQRRPYQTKRILTPYMGMFCIRSPRRRPLVCHLLVKDRYPRPGTVRAVNTLDAGYRLFFTFKQTRRFVDDITPTHKSNCRKEEDKKEQVSPRQKAVWTLSIVLFSVSQTLSVIEFR